MNELGQACRTSLNATVTAFRLGMEAQGSEHLVCFIDSLMQLFEQYPSTHTQQVNSLLLELFQAQARKDFLRVADLLEYGELLPSAC